MATEKKTSANTQAVEERMRYYNAVRKTPENAKKPIEDGRLRGKTDINPMWRIKVLTETFGPCGFGWKYTITRKWNEGTENNAAAFVDVELYIKDPVTNTWSEAIPGTGGAVFKRLENSGKLYVDDDCYKKATTDALSVACKALGIGADVYWQSDTTKYSTVFDEEEAEEGEKNAANQGNNTQQTKTGVTPEKEKRTLTPQSASWASNVARVANCPDTIQQIHDRITAVYNITEEHFKRLIKEAGRAAA